MIEEINLAVDAELLAQVSAGLAELGVTMNEAIATFVNAVARDRCIFEQMLEDEHDIAVAEQSLAEYIRDGERSRPIAELWRRLGLDTSEEDKKGDV